MRTSGNSSSQLARRPFVRSTVPKQAPSTGNTLRRSGRCSCNASSREQPSSSHRLTKNLLPGQRARSQFPTGYACKSCETPLKIWHRREEFSRFSMHQTRSVPHQLSPCVLPSPMDTESNCHLSARNRLAQLSACRIRTTICSVSI